MSLGPLPGFRDFYPPEFAERAFIFRTWRDVAQRYGFIEYDGPPLEPLELYTRKSGEEIVAQLYNFTDKGGREVALRPEMTPTLARMVAVRANALRKPVRWFSIPQLFRYERQQRGRLREHFQLNLDIIGETEVTADAELLAAAIDIMRAFGLTASDVHARVSDRRLLQALLSALDVSEQQLPAVFAVADKWEREPRDVLERRLRQVGMADGTIGRLFAVLAQSDLAEIRREYAGVRALDEHFARLERYREYLDALGVGEWVRFDLSIVRGLAYYTGIVFELFDARGELRAICGGGRYDALLGALGGADLPALGFGMGDVVLGELLRDRGLFPTSRATLDYWIAAEDSALMPQVMRLASILRGRNKSVEYALRQQTVDKQRRAAGSAGAREFVTLPRDFCTTQTITVRPIGRQAGTAPGERAMHMDDWLATVG